MRVPFAAQRMRSPTRGAGFRGREEREARPAMKGRNPMSGIVMLILVGLLGGVAVGV